MTPTKYKKLSSKLIKEKLYDKELESFLSQAYEAIRCRPSDQQNNIKHLAHDVMQVISECNKNEGTKVVLINA